MATYSQGLRSYVDGSRVPDITPEEGRRMVRELLAEGWTIGPRGLMGPSSSAPTVSTATPEPPAPRSPPKP